LKITLNRERDGRKDSMLNYVEEIKEERIMQKGGVNMGFSY